MRDGLFFTFSGNVVTSFPDFVYLSSSNFLIMMKRKKQSVSKEQKVNEPIAPYILEKAETIVHFFSSPQEMGDANVNEWSRLSPLESMQIATAMILRIYEKELKKKHTDFDIHFK